MKHPQYFFLSERRWQCKWFLQKELFELINVVLLPIFPWVATVKDKSLHVIVAYKKSVSVYIY
jgi:hypothetical protein